MSRFRNAWMGRFWPVIRGRFSLRRTHRPWQPHFELRQMTPPDYPPLWKEPKPPKPPRVRKWRKRNRVYYGPLAGDTVWWEDPLRKNKHSELTRAGMERARQAGKNIGVLRVEEREGFAERFPILLAQLEQRTITRRHFAKELGISCTTLRRVLNDHLVTTRRTLTANKKRVALVV